MDYVGILKEAWITTWKHRTLWILGLFAAGGAGARISWSESESSFTQGSGDWGDFDKLPAELRTGLNEVSDFFQTTSVSEWLPWVLAGIAALVVVGVVFWVLGLAAKGGIVAQTNEALAGRKVSARKGWRTGFGLWGRMFLVGLLLSLPIIVLALVTTVVLVGPALLIFGAMETWSATAPGLIGLGLLIPIVGLAFLAVSLLISMISEVSYRYAVLQDMTALESIKASWADLRAKRGMATMWLVMLLVGIAAAVAAGIIMVPLLIVAALSTGATVISSGASGWWILLPVSLILMAVGMLLKAIYTTYTNAAWTSFYRHMTGDGDLQNAAPLTTEPPIEPDGAVHAD